MGKHGRDRLEVWRNIVDAARRVIGLTAEIGEVETAVTVEDEIVNEIAVRLRDDDLHIRAVWLDGDDRTCALEVSKDRNEDTSVLVDSQPS